MESINIFTYDAGHLFLGKNQEIYSIIHNYRVDSGHKIDEHGKPYPYQPIKVKTLKINEDGIEKEQPILGEVMQSFLQPLPITPALLKYLGFTLQSIRDNDFWQRGPVLIPCQSTYRGITIARHELKDHEAPFVSVGDLQMLIELWK